MLLMPANFLPSSLTTMNNSMELSTFSLMGTARSLMLLPGI